jgi:hypothetical protein
MQEDICPPRCFRAIVSHVFRSRVSRFVSVALLFLAGSVEPVWEIGHAVAHAEASHHSHELSESASDPETPGSRVSALPDDDGHGHPVFHAPVRPSSDLTLALAQLPANTLWLPLDDLAIRRPAFSSVSARASPRTAGTTQPRAPPPA